MTVYANKPAFNVREKLKELDYGRVPYDKMPAGSVLNVSRYIIASDNSWTTTSSSYSSLGSITHNFNKDSKYIFDIDIPLYRSSTGTAGGANIRLISGDTVVIQAGHRLYINGTPTFPQYHQIHLASNGAIEGLDGNLLVDFRMASYTSGESIATHDNLNSGRSIVTIMEIAQ